MRRSALVTLTALLTLFGLTQAQLKREDRKLTKEQLFAKFESLMKKLGLWDSLTANEKKFRFETFKKNLQVIEKFVPPPLGKDGRPLLGSVAASFRKGINKFAFLTDEEFRQRYLIQKNVLYAQTSAQSLRDVSDNLFDAFVSPGRSRAGSQSDEIFLEDLDDEVDTFDDDTDKLSSLFDDLGQFLDSSQNVLVANGVIKSRGRILQKSGRRLQSSKIPGVKDKVDWEHLFNPVYDQLNCNSCYAAASLGAIEAAYKKSHAQDKEIFLSVQEILDCSTDNSHCLGGQPSSVMEYVKEYGVAYAREYPYEQKKVRCRAKYFLNQVKKTSGPRILESLLSSVSGRVLQYSRFASDPRFNSYSSQRSRRVASNPFNSVYQSPSNTQRSGFGGTNTQTGFSQFGGSSQPNRFWNQRVEPHSHLQVPHTHQPQSNFNNFYANSFPRQGLTSNRNWSQNQNFGSRISPRRRQPQPQSSKTLKLDGPNRTYYYEIVSNPNGVKKVAYKDLLGRDYVPSFVKKQKSIPVVNPDNKKKDDLSELTEDEDLLPIEADDGKSEKEEADKEKAEEEARKKKEAADKKKEEEEEKRRKEEEEKRRKEEEEKRRKEEEEKRRERERQEQAKREAERIKQEEEKKAEEKRKAEIQKKEEEQRRQEAAKKKAEEQRKKEEAAQKAKQIAEENAKKVLGPRFEKLKGFFFIKKNVIDVIKALQYGPVVTAHFVSESFKFYESGVFDGDGCDDSRLEYVNHASVIVGYDLTADVPYFKLRNSWASDWGEKGYYRMKIGELTKSNPGICLVAGTPFMVFPYIPK